MVDYTSKMIYVLVLCILLVLGTFFTHIQETEKTIKLDAGTKLFPHMLKMKIEFSHFNLSNS
jgi:hypothetical protein